jgi:uncharacterized membrane protein
MSKNKQLVMAFFDSEAAADSAVDALKRWDKASKEIKLGGIGILTKDSKGEIKTHLLGRRHTGAGAVLGAIAGVLSGGITLIGGAIVGGILGAFFHKGLSLSKDDLTRIDQQLNDGHAAVGVLAEADEAEAVTAKLAELGGVAETHEVTEEAVEQAVAAAAASPEESAPTVEEAAAAVDAQAEAVESAE